MLHDRDVHHGSAVAAIRHSVAQGRALATTWEVVGEAFTLIRTRIAPRRRRAPAMTVLDWAEESGVIIVQSAEADQRRTIEILRAHADVGLSYVDALVLAVADRLSAEELLTVDSHLGAVRLDRTLIVTVV